MLQAIAFHFLKVNTFVHLVKMNELRVTDNYEILWPTLVHYDAKLESLVDAVIGRLKLLNVSGLGIRSVLKVTDSEIMISYR